MRKTLVHIPHDGTMIPAELLRSVCVPIKELIRQHNALRDTEVTAFAPRNADETLRFPISRVFCDVERFIEAEPMDSHGMGFCYTHGFDGTRLKQVTKTIRDQTLVYYAEHHRKLNAFCKETDSIFLLDLHSYSPQIVPEENRINGRSFPEVCLGYESPWIREDVIAAAKNAFSALGLTVDLNYPYSGSMVPSSLLHDPQICDCISLMIEIRRDVYMNQNGILLHRTELLRKAVEQIVKEVILFE